MARFNVPVTCEAPEQAAKALDGARIPRFGPGEIKYTDTPDPPLVVPSMFARIDADDATAAEVRVREIVGDDCQVGPAEVAVD